MALVATRASRLALLLTLAVLVAGVRFNSWTAGGPDAYSYAQQMDQWLSGELTIPVPIADAAPWPDALVTFAPFGYRAVPAKGAIAPMTAPGMPLLMAAFKAVGGHPAGFLIPPLCGALMVWATFLIGRRLGSESIGLGSAWLVATSPTFLMMFKAQMSDVPAAAFWTLATYWTLGATTRSAAAAGLAASVAILIRPNAVPLAAVLFGALLALPRFRRATHASSASTDVMPALAFAAGAVPGCLLVAIINYAVHGSPMSSGYGRLEDLFAIANVPINLERYGGWLLDTQTPFAVTGLLLLLIAPARVWPTPAARCAARMLFAFAVVSWLLYLAYIPFEAWWFLRFMLPAWPAMLIGTAAVATLLVRGHSLAVPVRAAFLLALGVYGVMAAWQRDVFPPNEGERRYATIATMVAQHTEPDAMILASIHAGPTRYYSGRATLRYDALDEAWLDRAIEWLRARGRHPYVLVDEWELPGFTKRFAAHNDPDHADLRRLAPVLVYQAHRISGRLFLFDLLRPAGPTLEPPPMRDPRPLCVLPGPRARLS